MPVCPNQPSPAFMTILYIEPPWVDRGRGTGGGVGEKGLQVGLNGCFS